ncbi:uncharacterized protein LOC144101619 [Amblyomma americanum]
MVVAFITGWSRKMGSSKKPFEGSRQRGPFGLPQPTEAEHPENTAEEDVNRPIGQAAPRTIPTGPRKLALPAIDAPPAAATPDRPTAAATQAIKTSEAPLSPLTDSPAECSTVFCRKLKDWFNKTVAVQADPCQERNTFVCDPSVAFPGFSVPLDKPKTKSRAR